MPLTLVDVSIVLRLALASQSVDNHLRQTAVFCCFVYVFVSVMLRLNYRREKWEVIK